MPKLPKFSNFTDLSSIVNKMKNAIDNIAGTGATSVTEEALAQESDPTKAKLLEIELLLNRLQDIMAIQNRTVNELRASYHQFKTIMQEGAEKDKNANSSTSPSNKTENLDSSSQKPKNPQDNEDKNNS